jgi:uncharacterized protein YfaS (alpha-2-macroglobulin family)
MSDRRDPEIAEVVRRVVEQAPPPPPLPDAAAPPPGGGRILRFASGAMRRHPARALVAAVVAFALAAGAIVVVAGDRDGAPDRPSGVAAPVTTAPDRVRASGPFTIALSAGEPIALAAVAPAVVEGEALTDDEAAAVVDGLPPLPRGDEAAPFRRPAESLPRPRVGETIDRPFGLAPQPPPEAPAAGPLEVLRYQPEGDVGIAPSLSVTFNQPMVPLGTLEQLDAADVPVVVTPELDGRWRWIGTRTLRFEFAGAVDRLPMATEYTVEVPAGTVSQNGGVLAEAVRWTFRTPPPQVQSFTPKDTTVDVEQVFVATFDQRIDPQAVVGTIALYAGDQRVPVRAATSDEIAADEQVRQIVDEAEDGRFVAFRPESRLPNGTELRIEIGPGTPSAEGPRLTETASTHTATTYAELAVKGQACGYFAGCRPGTQFVIEMTNGLDLTAFTPDGVTIEPDVDARVGAYGSTVTVDAATKANTTYTVTLPADLRDQFGQTLGAPAPVTFDVKPAQPALMGFPRQLVTTDPMAERPTVSVTSAGHETLRVDVYSVTAAQWGEYQDFLERRWYEGEGDEAGAPTPPWPLVSTRTLPVEGGGIELTESIIDLGDDLPGATGHRVVVVSPTQAFEPRSDLYWQNRPTIAWVQSTQLAVDALATHDELVAWATDLRTGAPVEGATVQLGGTQATAVTDAEGLARLSLARSRFLVATLGDDTAVLPADSVYEWSPYPRSDSVVGFAFDDRGIYRPGETVHVKGWLRRVHTASDGRVTPLTDAATADWSAYDAFGNELGTGTVELNDLSGFTFDIAIPPGAALGPAYVEVQATDGGIGGAASLTLQIQEFRRPEFEVLTRAESPPPHLLTQPVTVAAVAQYFSGGTLADAPTTWQVTTSEATYEPPHWPQFTFGEWRPPWIEDYGFGDVGVRFAGDLSIDPCCGPLPDEERHTTYTGRTDATGTHYLQIDFEGDTPDLPVTVSANAAVEDVNRQSFASNLELLVHPASLYVGVRSTRQFVREGENLEVEAIVTDIDGAAVAGRPFTVTVARVVERFEAGEWVEEEVDPQGCELTSSTEPVTCSVRAATGGQYKVTAVVADDAGGRNRSELVRWVSGAEAVPSRQVEQEQATVVPDRESYAPGDTAELLVIAPFGHGEGLLTITANGGTATRRFTLNGGSAVVDVPITQGHVPGISLHVDVAGQAPRLRDDGTTDPDLPPRPAFATAALSLPVEPVAQTLSVTAEPRATVAEPGDAGTIEVEVRGAGGAPVANADVAVVVVDEAVLSLVGYELPDPIGAFYSPRYEERWFDYLRASLVLARPELFPGAEEAPAPASTVAQYVGTGDDADLDSGGEGGARNAALRAFRAEGGASESLEVRTDFGAVALFEPSVRTDGAGRASVEFDLPDSVTRYRVMAVAAAAPDAFGAGESTLTAQLPLSVRPSAPRFANFGDRFELPVVVHNQTGEPVTADVVVETANLALTGPAGRRVEVPANERVEVRFPVAAEAAGTARFRVTGVATTGRDSVVGELPVYTPITTEAFATYGVVDAGAVAQPLVTPAGVVPQFGGLEIDTSSTALQALTDAIVYMEEYDYASADAYASRITALTSLRDVFAAFGGEGVPSPSEVDDRIRSDVAALVALQRDDGGFGTWTRFGDAQPYASVQATEALVLARLAGFDVDGGAHDRALRYIRDIESHFPDYWGPQERAAVSAYALRVRERAGDRDPAKAEALYRSDPALALDAIAWLWPVVDDPAIDAEIERTILNRANDTPSGVTFTSGYDDRAYLVLASDRRTDAIVLDALLTRRPASDLVPKVVLGLIGNQVNGRWGNVQENGAILVALGRYFAAFEGQTPAFVARAWLGDTYVAEHAYEGRTIQRQHTLVPMSELGGDPDVVVAKDGPGRLYYRLGLRYAPDDLVLDPRDEGFVVDRVYEAVDDPADVSRDADGTWRIAPGAMVRVRVTMVADANRTNMVLVDPLPAGLEAVNPGLAASPRPPADPNEQQGRGLPEWYGWTWFDHENLRDDRVEAYSAYLVGGTYEYSYVARATTPGEFVVPPARAEEIYAPEVFGRSASDRVVVGA